MSDYNMDNIPRTLEEDLLLDLIETPITLYTEGVDSAIDVDAANYRFNSLYDKIKALAALLYLKESTILTERKEDAIRGSIFFNRDTNNIEFFDGETWNSNIFGKTNVLDSKSIDLSNLEVGTDSNGISYSVVTDLHLNMNMTEDQIIFIVVDGDLIDKKFFYLDDSNKKKIIFTSPITVYDNISYYIVGSELSTSGSIPRYETVEYTSDGINNVFPLSNNKDFVVTYKSSILVSVNGLVLRENEYSLNSSRNGIIINNVPSIGSIIEIRTQYGVVTDFRTSISYVEQIVEAEVDMQETFQYNGVCDAIKVYWNGLRLLVGKDFEFNYVQKLVVMKKHIKDQIKIGDIVIIEKELVPMSKEPMQGMIVEEKMTTQNNYIETKYACNGIVDITLLDDLGNQTKLISDDYFVNNNVITFIKNILNTDTIYIRYLTNSNISKDNIIEIDDTDESREKVWSSQKTINMLNDKANINGSIHQDFKVKNLNISSNSIVSGSSDILGNLLVNGKIRTNGFIVGDEINPFLEVVEQSNTLQLNQNMNIRKNLTVYGDLRVEGVQTGAMLDQQQIADNSIKLNANLTSTDTPVQSESSIIVNRGRNGEARLSFDETDQKWKVFTTEYGELKDISLGGHKHTISDFESSGIPIYHSLNSTTNTSDDFYDNGDYRNEIEKKLSQSEPVKTISRLNLKKSSIIAGELENDIQSNTILSLENYQGLYDNSGNIYTKEDSFAVIEDGSIISNSKGAFKLPSGSSNKRWENDSNFCNIPSQNFTTNLDSLSGNKWQNAEGLIRYNTDEKCVEMKIDGSWVKFYKPDVSQSKQYEMSYSRGRYIQDFSISDFVELSNESNIDTLGMQQGDKVLKINHNLNSLYVRVDIFDDKRTPFPLLYKCVDENNVYITFPSNIVDLSNSIDVHDWIDFLSASLHSTRTVEGPGHNGKVDTLKSLNTNNKFVAFVTAL